MAGSDGCGRTGTTIPTLLHTAKTNNVDPLAWLTQTLERIANGWPSSEIKARAVELYRLNGITLPLTSIRFRSALRYFIVRYPVAPSRSMRPALAIPDPHRDQLACELVDVLPHRIGVISAAEDFVRA
ncbi:hypothetical protein AJ87_21275 [Rhizobium yanglingense]|nr:hypothetical protein AJ87_21275 [Rhizobium yanglingense]